jgi:hypothetical protein
MFLEVFTKNWKSNRMILNLDCEIVKAVLPFIPIETIRKVSDCKKAGAAFKSGARLPVFV